MKTIDEMIAVMQSYKEGKTIEYKNWKELENTEWKETDNPSWDWYLFDYRVKPEPKYVPYDSTTEVEKDKWIKYKYRNTLKRIMTIRHEDNTIRLGDNPGYITLKTLFDNYTYEDGTPCGKLVEGC